MTVRLNGTTLTILRQSASEVGLVHAPSIDLATGAFQCSETCPARGDHKHSTEMEAVRAALIAFCDVTGWTWGQAVRELARKFLIYEHKDSEFLQYQCGEHPDQLAAGLPAWAAPDTLVHQAARLTLNDRAAIVTARKGGRKVAA